MSESNKIILKIFFIGIIFIIGAFICLHFNYSFCKLLCSNIGGVFIGSSIGLKLFDVIEGMKK